MIALVQFQNHTSDKFFAAQGNFNTISYYEMVDINSSDVSEPPPPKLLSDEKIENVKRAPQKFSVAVNV